MPPSSFFHRRHGTTLIELIIFLAVLSLVIATALPLLFSTTENRLLQQTISIVEQNGTQIMQNATLAIRNAERIVSPATSETGSLLVLQMGSGSINPTIIANSGGVVIIIKRSTREDVSTEQVAVQDFTFRNTSASDTRQSVEISFRVSRTIRLQQPHSYSQWFTMAVHLHPNDVPVGDSCGCGLPSCLGDDRYEWDICEEGMCLTAETSLECP